MKTIHAITLFILAGLLSHFAHSTSARQLVNKMFEQKKAENIFLYKNIGEKQNPLFETIRKSAKIVRFENKIKKECTRRSRTGFYVKAECYVNEYETLDITLAVDEANSAVAKTCTDAVFLKWVEKENKDCLTVLNEMDNEMDEVLKFELSKVQNQG